MYEFKDFNIEMESTPFSGKSIEMEDVFNVPIVVQDYKVGPSTKKPGTTYLTLQIELDGKQRIIFTGSQNLIRMIKKVPQDKYPFRTTIVNKNKAFYFT